MTDTSQNIVVDPAKRADAHVAPGGVDKSLWDYLQTATAAEKQRGNTDVRASTNPGRADDAAFRAALLETKSVARAAELHDLAIAAGVGALSAAGLAFLLTLV